jgi:hypothetical protein
LQAAELELELKMARSEAADHKRLLDQSQELLRKDAESARAGDRNALAAARGPVRGPFARAADFGEAGMSPV